MNTDLWFGAATTLAGAGLGGSISFVLNRQQIKFAQAQRREAALEEKYRRSVDRRFQAYTDFLTRARTYRDSIRPNDKQSGPMLSIVQIDEYARSADTASAFVYLVTESTATHEACRSIMRALSEIQGRLHSLPARSAGNQWPELDAKIAAALRQFQVAARAELEVSGVKRSSILTHHHSAESKDQASGHSR